METDRNVEQRRLDRRAFMRAAGTGFLAALGPRSLHALERADAVFASGFRALMALMA